MDTNMDTFMNHHRKTRHNEYWLVVSGKAVVGTGLSLILVFYLLNLCMLGSGILRKGTKKDTLNFIYCFYGGSGRHVCC